MASEMASEIQNMHPTEKEDTYVATRLSHARADRRRHPMFEQMEKTLEISDEIISIYDRSVEKEPWDYKLRVPRAEWKKDEQGVKDLLRYGRRYGEKLAESIIVPRDRASLPHPAKDNMNDTEGLATEMFEGSRRRAELGGTWGQVARDQLNAFAGLIRTLPG